MDSLVVLVVGVRSRSLFCPSSYWCRRRPRRRASRALTPRKATAILWSLIPTRARPRSPSSSQTSVGARTASGAATYRSTTAAPCLSPRRLLLVGGTFTSASPTRASQGSGSLAPRAVLFARAVTTGLTSTSTARRRDSQGATSTPTSHWAESGRLLKRAADDRFGEVSA